MKKYIMALCLIALAMPAISGPKNKGKSKKAPTVSEEQRQELFDAVKNKRFTWAHGDVVFTENFKLDRSGEITGYLHANERSWEINKKGKLIIRNASGNIQWVFVKQEDKRGKFYFETEDRFSLLER